MERKVACLLRKNIPELLMQYHTVLQAEKIDVENDFNALEFLEKQTAEINEDYKQLIPYVLLQTPDHQIALYKRKGNEQRLHGLWSAGFGGHIEDFDYHEGMSIATLIKQSALREIREEFSIDFDSDLIFRGLINEEQTKVGRTHIGLVFSVVVMPQQYKFSTEIGQIEWVNIETTNYYKKELWSEMALELIKKK